MILTKKYLSYSLSSFCVFQVESKLIFFSEFSDLDYLLYNYLVSFFVKSEINCFFFHLKRLPLFMYEKLTITLL